MPYSKVDTLEYLGIKMKYKIDDCQVGNMSRSYKHSPIYKDSTRKGPTFKSGKQIANHVVRRVTDIPNGSGYKKAFCSYNISDYRFRMEERKFKQEWEKPDSWIHNRFKCYKDAHRWWIKYYRNK